MFQGIDQAGDVVLERQPSRLAELARGNLDVVIGLVLDFFDGHSKWLNIRELARTKTDASGALYYPYFTKTLD